MDRIIFRPVVQRVVRHSGLSGNSVADIISPIGGGRRAGGCPQHRDTCTTSRAEPGQKNLTSRLRKRGSTVSALPTVRDPRHRPGRARGPRVLQVRGLRSRRRVYGSPQTNRTAGSRSHLMVRCDATSSSGRNRVIRHQPEGAGAAAGSRPATHSRIRGNGSTRRRRSAI